MTGRWNKNKTKKTLETSLGQAPKDAEKATDLSHLRKPITTSIFGLKQVLTLFQTATSEVQEYITYECDVLYECRICRTIFRSLANFILHKRSYCKEKYNNLDGANRENAGGFVVEATKSPFGEEEAKPATLDNEEKKEESQSAEKSSPPSPSDTSKNTKNEKKNILPIIDKLIKRQEIEILAKNTLNEDFSTKAADNSDDDVVFVSEENNVMLQKIDTSNVAVFQTSVKDPLASSTLQSGLMKSEVMEIHGILENNEAVLGQNGKVCTFETNKKISKPNIPKQDLVCTECNFTFSTEKTLTHHIKYKHNKTCIVYPCPDCKETFANAWSVYRHLYKVHRRTSSQVRRMRALIHSSGIRKDQEPEKKKEKTKVENEENQWMNNFEKDKDLQMCGGCGKRFERKAALHSHSQMCTKRIAVCNTIKEKMKAEVKGKVEKVKSGVKVVKGSAKRKASLVYAHRPAEACFLTPRSLINLSSARLIKIKKKNTERRLEALKESQSEIISDSEEEKENAEERHIGGDVIITKYKDNEEEKIEKNELPEIEIFTISDDSSESEKKTPLELESKEEVSEEYKEYMNDDLDQCFFAKAAPFMDKEFLKCTPCETEFMSQYQLLQHMSLHFSWFRFQCSKCSFMSFYKYDCTTHAYECHGTPNALIGSTVMLIPKWKVLCGAHNFAELANSEAKVMPQLEVEKVDENEMKVGVENETSETIVLEDDEMPDICNTTVILSDEEVKAKAGPSRSPKEMCVANNRPVRNRTKSVKTVQNDFIYDLAKVLKLNDNSIKNGKLKKSLGKS